MKKILFPALLMCITAIGFTGCAGEEDDIFSATAAERLNESSSKYSARLEAQPNGWAMQYYPTYQDEAPFGSGYLILMDFNSDFSVKVAMDNDFSGNSYLTDTSVWEVISDNGPVLSFNSYNKCMHAFSDPEDILWTEDNEQGEGCGGDYEFIIVDAPEDASYMMLKGKKRNTYNLLTPIEQGVDYAAYLADVKAFHNKVFSENELTSNLMFFGDSIYRMDGSSDGLPNLYPLEADAISNEYFNPFLITKRSNDYYIRFRDVIKIGDMEGTLQELRYDSIQQQFIGTDNPKWRITGYWPYRFFGEYVKKYTEKTEGKRDYNMLGFSVGDTMSDKFKTYVDNLTADFSTMKKVEKKSGKTIETPYGFVGMSFQYNTKNESYQWNVRYTPGVKDVTWVGYMYDFENKGDHTVFTNTGIGLNANGKTDGSTNVYNKLQAVRDIIELLSQEFVITAGSNSFDLSTLRLTSASDPELWFTVSINK